MPVVYDCDRAASRREALRILCPDIARALAAQRDSSAESYLAALWSARPAEARRPACADRARAVLLEAVREDVHETYGPLGVDADTVCNQLAAVPVVATASHNQILFEPVFFATTLAAAIGCASQGGRYVLSRTYSTLTLKSTSRTGPGVLDVGSAVLNVFGLPSEELHRTSLCGLQGSLRLAFSIADNAPADAIRIASRLREFVGPRCYRSASQALRAANLVLWRRLGLDRFGELILLDDRAAAKAVAQHLRDGDGPIHDILFDPGRRDAFLELRRKARAAPRTGAFVSDRTALLWGVSKRRIRPLQLRSGKLVNETREISIDYTPASLADALERNELTPDLSLDFLACFLLPGLVPMGGPSQAIYLPIIGDLYRQVFPGQVGTWLSHVSRCGDMVQGILEFDGRPADLLFIDPSIVRTRVADLVSRPLRRTMGRWEGLSYLPAML
jgi:hypothetical protein